jgi:hypothetical protein
MAGRDTRKHLMLLLGQRGFGETILGLRLASELRSQGDEVFLLAHDSNLKLLDEWGTQCSTISSLAAPLLQLYITSSLQKFAASSIILSDYLITTLFFDRYGLDSKMLSSFGLPIFAIDTWDSGRTQQKKIDLLVNEQSVRSLWPEIVQPICPVPFLAPGREPGYYSSLPQAVSVPRKIRRHLHHTLGVDEASKAVLFCTAEWQHPNYDSTDNAARKCAAAMPLLIADYLSRVGDSVHLVHVGPRPFDLQGRLEGRYHWLPPLRPPDFDMLVASMDLFLSANISATTIAKAMASGVPVFVLQNSVRASSREEAEAASPNPLSDGLKRWLDDALPLFPFALWPLGYHQLITPLLANNPYVSALDAAEMLDEQRVEAALRSLLFDSSAKEDQQHRQALYLDEVKRLPRGPELIHSALEARSLIAV